MVSEESDRDRGGRGGDVGGFLVMSGCISEESEREKRGGEVGDVGNEEYACLGEPIPY